MDKIALITGASKGIGKALAYEFAKNGYSLILIARNLAELKELQTDLKNRFQCTSKILSVDLAKPDCIHTILTEFKDDLDKIDVLVNNAGFGAAKKFTDMTVEEVDGMMGVNMVALTNLTYRILPHMVARKQGRVLNVASTAAFGPGPYMAVYYASKAYVYSLSLALRVEYAKDGIDVSVLCPGVTSTEFHARAGTDKTHLVDMPGMTSEQVAEAAYAGVMKGKRVIVPGFMNKLNVMMMWLTPNSLIARITGAIQRPKV